MKPPRTVTPEEAERVARRWARGGVSWADAVEEVLGPPRARQAGLFVEREAETVGEEGAR